MALQIVEDVAVDAQRIDQHAIGVELDQVEAAERRGILVLLAAGDAQVVAFDLVVQLGQFVASRAWPV